MKPVRVSLPNAEAVYHVEDEEAAALIERKAKRGADIYAVRQDVGRVSRDCGKDGRGLRRGAVLGAGARS